MSNVAQKLPLLTIDEASARLHFSTKTVRRLIAKGELPALRPSGGLGALRFDPDELERWLETQRTSTKGAA